MKPSRCRPSASEARSPSGSRRKGASAKAVRVLINTAGRARHHVMSTFIVYADLHMFFSPKNENIKGKFEGKGGTAALASAQPLGRKECCCLARSRADKEPQLASPAFCPQVHPRRRPGS